jgi:hypothetical protein
MTVWHLMQSDQKEDCLRLLNLWSELFPKSALACEKRAEFYEKYGEPGKALAVYQDGLARLPSDPFFDTRESYRRASEERYKKEFAALTHPR